jgi:hypothetical protein
MQSRLLLAVLLTLFACVCVFVMYILCAISTMQVFNLVGGMTLLLAPLAPGSPIPVRQVRKSVLKNY